MNLLSNLNPEQKRAVKARDGVYLVLAGAGTGKTRVLVHRAAYLVQENINPENIVLLTFTRKAADEMVTRAARMGNSQCRRIIAGTFHSFCLELLKRFGAKIGIPKFTMIDAPTMEDAVRSVRNTYIKREGVDNRRFPRAGTVSNIIGYSRETRTSIAKTIQTRWPDHEDHAEFIQDIADEYVRYKDDHTYLDFSDLLEKTVDLLRKKSMHGYIRRQYQYVMIDEYQDTNVVQDEIVKLISANGNLMVVGDDMQSIYGFRGAHYMNIVEFPERYREAHIIKLVHNYRSTNPILRMANAISDVAVMELGNPDLRKELFSKKDEGTAPQLYIARDKFEQARAARQKIRNLVADGVPMKDIAVLFRSGSTSNELEPLLNSDEITYVKFGGLRFSETKHVRDCMAYLKVLFNSRDSLSWQRLLGLLQGIGPAKSSRITEAIVDDGEGVRALLNHPDANKHAHNLFKVLRASRKKGLSVFDRLYEIIDHYQQFILNDPDYMKRLGDLDSLLEIAKNYSRSSKFLEDLTVDPPRDKNDTELLTLSTIHSAKGLEWPYVIFIGVSESTFPPPYPGVDEHEERRLFYVGTTRAADELSLFCHEQPSYFFGDGTIRDCVETRKATEL